MPESERAVYKATILLSALSSTTLNTLLSSGLTATQRDDPEAVINVLRNRCNQGRNRHVWRQQFALRKQRANEPIDEWLCDLRSLASKSKFANNCCAQCEITRILGQVAYGVHSNDVRKELLKKGDVLTLDDAIVIFRSAEAANQLAHTLRGHDT